MKDYACMCTVSQITNVILVLSSVEMMCVYISCVCEHVCVCFTLSHITNIILLEGSGDVPVCEYVCHRN